MKLPVKIKQEHHILSEFHAFLREISQQPHIKRIIPGRINRKQSGSSTARVHFSYETTSGLKFTIAKGSTAQELFIICSDDLKQSIRKKIEQTRLSYKK